MYRTTWLLCGYKLWTFTVENRNLNMEALQEIAEFLHINSRLDLKTHVVQIILGITGTDEGIELLLEHSEILRRLILLCQFNSFPIAKDAALALINISGNETGAKALLLISEASKFDLSEDPTDNLIHVCFRFILDIGNPLADSCCMILSNITRLNAMIDHIVALTEKANYNWEKIVHSFAHANTYNTNGANLHHFGSVLSNLTQSYIVRRHLVDRTRPIIRKLLPFINYQESSIRRRGVVGTLKNCCFDLENHEWLMSEEIDLLPSLLLPLAGPEEFDDEDNDKLPIDLQYLPETKQRETDSDIRIMLLEALFQLCATKRGREIIREKNIYVILREYHKWENNETALLVCENVINILIRTEEEIGVDNLKLVDIPAHVCEKFHKIDEESYQ